MPPYHYYYDQAQQRQPITFAPYQVPDQQQQVPQSYYSQHHQPLFYQPANYMATPIAQPPYEPVQVPPPQVASHNFDVLRAPLPTYNENYNQQPSIQWNTYYPAVHPQPECYYQQIPQQQWGYEQSATCVIHPQVPVLKWLSLNNNQRRGGGEEGRRLFLYEEPEPQPTPANEDNSGFDTSHGVNAYPSAEFEVDANAHLDHYGDGDIIQEGSHQIDSLATAVPGTEAVQEYNVACEITDVHHGCYVEADYTVVDDALSKPAEEILPAMKTHKIPALQATHEEHKEQGTPQDAAVKDEAPTEQLPPPQLTVTSSPHHQTSASIHGIVLMVSLASIMLAKTP
ncbi:hypothetical protein Pelo_14655 [Pelomyxa schiedti]|nr:hypothetical protein Pelo_14655 [Pelomyxa schiedti]